MLSSSPGILYRMCHLILLLHFKNCLRVETLLSWAGERLSLEQHFTFGGYLGVKILYQERGGKKNMLFSYFCHIVVFNCDFQYVMIVCEGKWRSSVQEQSCYDWSARKAALMFVWACHMVLITLVSNVPCAVFLGGLYLSCKCEILIWLVFIITLTSMSKCGWLNLLERWLSPPPNPSLHIHWRSQTVAMWQLFLDQNNCVQSY